MTDQSIASPGPSLTYTAHDVLRRRWITEIDGKARRLRIKRQCFGLKPKTIADCALEECVAVGTIEYPNTEGPASYGVYVDLKNGRRHPIPHTDNSLDAAACVANEVSAATGLPRLDIAYP